MPKLYTLPTLYDEALQINISKLKGWGYLKPEQFKSGTLNWSCNGNPTGSISIRVNTRSEQPYIELDYNYKKEPRNYKVYFSIENSNLGKGKIWYFICPKTNKKCRKLYSVDGYFLHREAFEGCMYESQTHSKKWRLWDRIIGGDLKIDELKSKVYDKHFKKYYAGKPTRKYLNILSKAESLREKSRSVSVYSIRQ